MLACSTSQAKLEKMDFRKEYVARVYSWKKIQLRSFILSYSQKSELGTPASQQQIVYAAHDHFAMIGENAAVEMWTWKYERYRAKKKYCKNGHLYARRLLCLQCFEHVRTFFAFFERCAPREMGTPRWVGAPRCARQESRGSLKKKRMEKLKRWPHWQIGNATSRGREILDAW